MDVQAECPWCGILMVPAQEVRCETEPGSQEGLCQVTCPTCGRQVYARTTEEGVRLIKSAGAPGMSGLVPFELLERRAGSPVGWDDVLDLQAGLEATQYPQAEIVDARGTRLARPGEGAVDPSSANIQ